MAAPDADKAIEELNGKEFEGRTLRVDAASDKPTNDGSGPRRFNPRGGRM
jgi:RNA recognition motif-containing protein